MTEPDERLVLSVQRDSFTPQSYADLSQMILDRARRSQCRPLFMEMHPDSDRQFTQYLAELDEPFERRDCLEFTDNLFISENLRAWPRALCLGTRYHSHLVNAWMGNMGL